MTDYALQPKVSDFYILRHAPCIAVLTENLFMDSPKDCAWLLTEDGRNTLAHIHATAIHYHLL
jgi:N-acetylmuramoyl-L-alanine amidase